MRTLTLRLAAGLASVLALTCFAPSAWPQKLWDAAGVLVAPEPPAASPGVPPRVGWSVGGAYVAWYDDRNYSTSDADAYAQRLLPAGAVAPGWPAAGLALSTHPSSQNPAAVVSDGTDGAFVLWEDRRGLAIGGTVDVYAQHLTSTGVADGWPEGGLSVAAGPGHQIPSFDGTYDRTVALPDGAGGFFFVYHDYGADGLLSVGDVYAQRITSSGAIAPGWPASGRAVCVAAGDQRAPTMVGDGAGGVIIAWTDWRGGVEAVYGMRLHGDGTPAAGWSPNGNLLVDAPGAQYLPWLVPDGAGGVYVAFYDLRNAPGFPEDPYDHVDLYATRITGAGVRAAGWPAGGMPVSAAADAQEFMVACEAGAGELYVAWTDPASGRGLVARMTGTGAIAPGFGPAGRAFANYTGTQYMEGIVPDGMGGAYLVWENYGSPVQIRAQLVRPDGSVALGWPGNGLPMDETPGAYQVGGATVGPDGLGGAIVVWDNAQPGRRGLHAQRLGLGGPTPVTVSLVSAEAEPDVVRLTWYAPQGGGIIAGVERRTEASEWVRLGSPEITSDGTLRYEDRAVTPGARYAYRLGYGDGTGVAYTAEVWVDVPAAQRFALRGLSPNPSAGDATVSFALTGEEPATLEIFDLGGRRVSERAVGSLGAGSHAVRLGERGRLAAGVYTVRLRQGGQVATRLAVVVR